MDGLPDDECGNRLIGVDTRLLLLSLWPVLSIEEHVAAKDGGDVTLDVFVVRDPIEAIKLVNISVII